MLAIVGVLGAAGALARTALGARRASIGLGALGVVLVVAFVLVALLPRRSDAERPAGVPGPGTTLGYVGSNECRACHPGEHASFTRTYHRTMTQVARPGAVRAPLDGRALVADDRTTRLERRGDEVWAHLPDPDAVIAGRPAPDVERRVVLTTGSHRQQAFWVAGEHRGDLRLVPWVWLVREQQFVPRTDAFLTPPGEPLPPVRWGSSCIACHAVAGEPHHDLERDTFEMRAAELGIACESCHGPGGRHAARHRDPIARYVQHASRSADPTIVQPARLAPERSAAVCGQCHAYAFPRDEDGWWQTGYARAFVAGDALEPSRVLLARTMGRDQPTIDLAVSSVFWPDGSVRVGGREYNGLVTSRCYVGGEGRRKATCLSCHAMHRGDPAGQIAPERIGDAACTTCHAPAPGHSRHVAVACVDCHMPKTSFALLSAVRSHRIDSPRAAPLPEKPNACVLCHLDRSPAWVARALAARSPRTGDGPPEGVDERAAGLLYGLSADAGVRALVADALASAPVADGFRAALLDEMQRDPYAAVRFVAARSRRAVPAGAAVMPLDRDTVKQQLAERDDRAVTIAE